MSLGGPCILSDPDITGIGVRTAIYAQNLFSFVPAAFVLWDGHVTYHEIETIEQQSSTILITAFALLLSAIIQARTSILSNLHATIILNLSWMNNTNLFIYLLVYAYHRVLLRERRKDRWDTAKEASKAWKDRVLWIGCCHFILMGGFGIWVWRKPGTFGGFASGSCTHPPVLIFLGRQIPLISASLRNWSLLIYSFLLTPILNVLLPAIVFLIPILYYYIFQSHKENNTLKHPQPLHYMRWFFIIPTFAFLFIVNLILLIDTESTLKENKNRGLLQPGDNSWTFGQTLALLLLLVPLRDFYDTLVKRRGRRPGVMKKFVDAAEKGDEVTVKKLLDEEPDGQTKDHALMLAAANGKELVLKYLLDVHSTKSTGENMAFLLAAYQKQHKTVQWFAKWFATTKTSLMQEDIDLLHSVVGAAGKQFEGISKILIQHAVNIRPDSEECEREFLTASQNGLVDCMKVLLKLGVPGTTKTCSGETAYEFMVTHGCLDMVQFWCNTDSQDSINAQNDKNETLLHIAASKGHWRIVRLLCDSNADVNARTIYRRTALHEAAANGNLNTVKLLLERNADINAETTESKTALHEAAANGHLGAVELLCDQGADVDARSKASISTTLLVHAEALAPARYNATALHLATISGHLDIVEALCNRNADINAMAYGNETALYKATVKGHLNIVRFLSDRNADINAKTNFGETALHEAASNGLLDIVKLLCERNVDVNTRTGYNKAAIHLAATKGHLDIVKLLCARDADLSAKDEQGNTALQAAKRHKHIEVVKFLSDFKHTSDINRAGNKPKFKCISKFWVLAGTIALWKGYP